MKADPQQEHQWLQKLVGEWGWESECDEPGKPKQKMTGSERVRSLGGLWVVGEGQGEMPGGGIATTVLTLGYDPQKGYLGTWIGSMMTHLWVYRGTLDAAGRALTLEAEGPSFTEPGKTALYHDVITFDSDDTRRLTARVRGNDGQWTEMMTMTYRRKT